MKSKAVPPSDVAATAEMNESPAHQPPIDLPNAEPQPILPTGTEVELKAALSSAQPNSDAALAVLAATNPEHAPSEGQLSVTVIATASTGGRAVKRAAAVSAPASKAKVRKLAHPPQEVAPASASLAPGSQPPMDPSAAGPDMSMSVVPEASAGAPVSNGRSAAAGPASRASTRKRKSTVMDNASIDHASVEASPSGTEQPSAPKSKRGKGSARPRNSAGIRARAASPPSVMLAVDASALIHKVAASVAASQTSCEHGASSGSPEQRFNDANLTAAGVAAETDTVQKHALQGMSASAVASCT